jgi:amino acid permease
MSKPPEHGSKTPTTPSSWLWPHVMMPPTFWWLVLVAVVAIVSWMIGAGHTSSAFWWLAIAAGTGLVGWLFGYWHGKTIGYSERVQEEAAAELAQRRLDRDARDSRDQATG